MRLLGARPCTANQSRAQPLHISVRGERRDGQESLLTHLTTSGAVDISHMQRKCQVYLAYGEKVGNIEMAKCR